MSVETIIAFLGVLGVGGLLGSILMRWYEQKKQTNEHDIRIFNQSNEVLSEQELSGIANLELGGNKIRDDDYSKLAKWCRFFDQTGNQYLDRKIFKENKKLVEALVQLTHFIGLNFFTIIGRNPNNDFQYLKPDWNPDYGNDPSPEKLAKYREYSQELDVLTEQVLRRYSEYRLAVKQVLKI